MEQLRYLLSLGVDIESEGWGKSPLTWAREPWASSGAKDPDPEGLGAKMIEQELTRRNPQTFERLSRQERKSRMESQFQLSEADKRLLEAAEDGDLDALKQAKADGANSNAQDVAGRAAVRNVASLAMFMRL